MADLAAQLRGLGPALAQGPAMLTLRQPGEEAAKKDADDDRHNQDNEQRRLDRAGGRRREGIEGNRDGMPIRDGQSDADDRERQ